MAADALRQAPWADARILDAGPKAVDRRFYADAIRTILEQRVDELAHDRNSICYRVVLPVTGESPQPAIVKVPRPGPQRTNDDKTFAGEAGILCRLPVEGITSAPELLARVEAGGEHYLFTTELPGKHPDARRHPLDATSLLAIADGLFVMDRRSLLHYDLKAANILVDGDRAAFIDFEFARFEDCHGAYAPATAAFCRDFNVSANPFLPTRSNVANFEFRSLHRYLLDVATTQADSAADDMLAAWLRARSTYHRRMSALLAECEPSSVEQMARAGGISTDEVRQRMNAAAGHEKLLVALFEQPHEAVARVERSLMAFRCAIFERSVEDAARWLNATLTEIGAGATTAPSLPGAYTQAIRRTLELVDLSVHPPG